MGSLAHDPYRVCCGQQHNGRVACPDGKVMCCLCFDRFDQAELYVDLEGNRWDTCKPCAEADARTVAERDARG